MGVIPGPGGRAEMGASVAEEADSAERREVTASEPSG